MESYNSVRGVVARYVERSTASVLYTPPASTADSVPPLTAAYNVSRFVGSPVRMYTSLGKLEELGVVEASEYVDTTSTHVERDERAYGEWRVAVRLTATGALRAFFEDAFRDGIFIAPAHANGVYSGMQLVWHSLCPGGECLERYAVTP